MDDVKYHQVSLPEETKRFEMHVPTDLYIWMQKEARRRKVSMSELVRQSVLLYQKVHDNE